MRLTALLLAPFLLTAIAAQAQGIVAVTCKDGTSYAGPSRRGACGGHGGEDFT